MKTRMVNGKNMPLAPRVNFIMPSPMIDQDTCTAPKVRPSFITRIILFSILCFGAVASPQKQDAFDD